MPLELLSRCYGEINSMCKSGKHVLSKLRGALPSNPQHSTSYRDVIF
jgi:hypothetical protein